MVKLQIEVIGKNSENKKEILGELCISENNTNLEITPDYIKSLDSKFTNKQIYGFNAYIECQRIILNISGFEYFSLEAFHNSNSYISALNIEGASNLCIVTNIHIKHVNINNSNFSLERVEGYDLNVGTNVLVSKLAKNRERVFYSSSLIDCSFKEARILANHKKLDIQNTYLKHLFTESDLCIQNFFIWQNSIINRVSLYSKVNLLKVKNSSITDFEFRSEAVIDEIEIEAYSIARIYNCGIETINHKSMDAWKIIMESARQDDNASTHAIAGYEYMKCQRKNLKFGIEKLGYCLLEFTTGYGFKPLLTIRLALFTWITFAMIFWCLTEFWNMGISPRVNSGIAEFVDCLYFSAISFTTTGYGDVVPKTTFTRMFCCIEPIMGSVLMAFLIFSLTRRYGSLK